jgi:formylglycine-generating enzyme
LNTRKPTAAPQGMRWIVGGEFWLGSNDHYPEEGPAARVTVNDFWIDATPVTNRQFRTFVQETGHVTAAELAPDPNQYPTAAPHMLRPGSSLFVRPTRQVSLNDAHQWWCFSFGTDWRHPWGPHSEVDALLEHPVVHVAFADAEAYARWAGKELPTEAEWEFAARGGLDRQPYAWGAELAPGGVPVANYWQGAFPHENLLEDGYERTSPVRTFPSNGYGLYDMIGNVWEWTADWYADRRTQSALQGCCIPRNPRGGSEDGSRDLGDPGAAFGRKVLKGGSHLCAANYCQRYRPAARYAQTLDTSTSHIGFRCVLRSQAGTG